MAASVLASILRFPAVGRRRPGPGQARELPGGEMACVVYQGPYEGISEAYNAIMAWLEPNSYRVAGPVRESDLRSPGDTDDPAQPRRTHSPAVIQLRRCARSEGSWPCGCRHRSLSSGAPSRLPGVDPFQCRYAA
ncbi:MAG: GyrI-like domain-containing protein [Bacteroidota bacterium]